MSKREKIILFVTFIGVLYGVHELFISPSPGKSVAADPKISGELVKLINGVIGKNSKKDSETLEGFIIAKAEARWEKDPFLRQSLPTKKTKQGPITVTDGPELIYSGYLEMGKECIAIINDMEYEAGELMEKEGYIVRAVKPKTVILESEGDGERIILRLQEEAF